MQNESKPSIDTLIRAKIEVNSTGTNGDIADAVIAELDPFEYERHLRYLIGARVPSVASEMRGSVTPSIRRGVSTKQSIIRDQYWPQFLSQRIAVEGGYKTMAEATPDDLRFAAAVRRTQAADLTNRADQFDALADLMVSAKVKHLEQLDASQGVRVLERAA